MKKSLHVRTLLLVLLLFFSTSLFASSPTVMLRNVADQMIAQLAKNKANLKGNHALVHKIVDSVLVPHIDLNRMAGLVVGRHYWYSATPAVRREFVYQFKRVVINTYAKAIETFDDDKVTIYPMRGQAAGRFASVNSVIVRKTGQRIPISYKLINKNGEWKVYDFSIENVSIVSNYRSQFGSVLAQGGLKQLVAKLRHYNARK